MHVCRPLFKVLPLVNTHSVCPVSFSRAGHRGTAEVDRVWKAGAQTTDSEAAQAVSCPGERRRTMRCPQERAPLFFTREVAF